MKKKGRVPDAIYERGYVYNFHFQLIWVTKYRCPAFTTPELVQDMKDIMNSMFYKPFTINSVFRMIS